MPEERSPQEPRDRIGDVTVSVEFDEADCWDPDVAGKRPAFVVTRDAEGVEIDRKSVVVDYSPTRTGDPGDLTSARTLAEMDEVALRRSQATGRLVIVAGFSSSGHKTVFDVESRPDGERELVEVGRIPITPSKPPAPLRRDPPPPRPARPITTPRARPRERRARRTNTGTAQRDGPRSNDDPDPPPLARLRALLRWLRRNAG